MAYYISGQGGPQRYIDTSQAVWGRWPMAGWPNCGGTMSGLGNWGGGCGCGGGGCPRCGMSPCVCSMRGLGTEVNPEDVQGGTGFAAGGKDIPQPPPGTPPVLPPPPGPITTTSSLLPPPQIAPSPPVPDEPISIAPAPPPGMKVDPSLAAPPKSAPGLPPTLYGYDSTTVLLGAGAALVAIYLLTKD